MYLGVFSAGRLSPVKVSAGPGRGRVPPGDTVGISSLPGTPQRVAVSTCPPSSDEISSHGTHCGCSHCSTAAVRFAPDLGPLCKGVVYLHGLSEALKSFCAGRFGVNLV